MTSNPEQALLFCTEALAAAELVGNQLGMVMAMHTATGIHIERGEWREAIPFVVRSMRESHRAGNRTGFGQVIGAAALIFEALGHHEAAATLIGTRLVARVTGQWEYRLAASGTAVKERLGEHRFTECAAHGETMTEDDMVVFVGEKLEAILS